MCVFESIVHQLQTHVLVSVLLDCAANDRHVSTQGETRASPNTGPDCTEVESMETGLEQAQTLPLSAFRLSHLVWSMWFEYS